MLTIVALAGLVVAAHHQIFDAFRNLRGVHLWVLPAMLFWQWLDYSSYARMYQHLYGLLGEKISRRTLGRVALELNFVNNVFPTGGVSGVSYFALRMRDADVPTSKSTVLQVFKFILIFVSFQFLLGLALIFLAFGHRVNSFTILVASSLVTLLLIGTMALAFIIGSQKRIDAFFTYITQLLNRLIHVVRRSHPETINVGKAQRLFNDLHQHYVHLRSKPKELWKPLINALLCNIAEIMTIYTVYLAFGHLINPGAVILAYAVASFAGVISILPGGVGAFEFLMTAVLIAAGVPKGLSVSVTLVYRVLNMGIQLPAGYYYYHKALRMKRAK